MKVKDLITLLQKEDPEAMAVGPGYESGLNEVTGVEAISLDLNVNSEWYYGAHEQTINGNGHPGVNFLCPGNERPPRA
jgi:hypothetical protein